MNQGEPQLIEGATFTDDRGMLSAVNHFSFEKVKRFYQVENFSTRTVRAWHGHLKEAKYAYVIQGVVLFGLVKLTNTYKPNPKAPVHRFVLTEKTPAILYMPPGYANGFKALVPKARVIFYSTATLDESKKDDYRFPFDYWGKAVWETENR